MNITLYGGKIQGEILIKKGLLLHHKNGNKHDNTFTNLELISVQVHNIKHAKGRTTTLIKCSWCNKDIIRENRRIKQGQKRFFCSHAHQVHYEQKILGVFKNK